MKAARPPRCSPAFDEPGFAYHATGEKNAVSIACGGGLHALSFFSDNPCRVGAFAHNGKAVILRVLKKGVVFVREKHYKYARTSIPADKVEILGVDQKWHPIRRFYRTRCRR